MAFMHRQKVREAHLACDVCNGFGYVTRAPNLDMATIEAMVKAGLGDKPVETVEVECKACVGTGKRTFRKE
jgi:hypothetical protein